MFCKDHGPIHFSFWLCMGYAKNQTFGAGVTKKTSRQWIKKPFGRLAVEGCGGNRYRGRRPGGCRVWPVVRSNYTETLKALKRAVCDCVEKRYACATYVETTFSGTIPPPSHRRRYLARQRQHGSSNGKSGTKPCMGENCENSLFHPEAIRSRPCRVSGGRRQFRNFKFSSHVRFGLRRTSKSARRLTHYFL